MADEASSHNNTHIPHSFQRSASARPRRQARRGRTAPQGLESPRWNPYRLNQLRTNEGVVQESTPSDQHPFRHYKGLSNHVAGLSSPIQHPFRRARSDARDASTTRDNNKDVIQEHTLSDQHPLRDYIPLGGSVADIVFPIKHPFKSARIDARDASVMDTSPDLDIGPAHEGGIHQSTAPAIQHLSTSSEPQNACATTTNVQSTSERTQTMPSESLATSQVFTIASFAPQSAIDSYRQGLRDARSLEGGQIGTAAQLPLNSSVPQTLTSRSSNSSPIRPQYEESRMIQMEMEGESISDQNRDGLEGLSNRSSLLGRVVIPDESESIASGDPDEVTNWLREARQEAKALLFELHLQYSLNLERSGLAISHIMRDFEAVAQDTQTFWDSDPDFMNKYQELGIALQWLRVFERTWKNHEEICWRELIDLVKEYQPKLRNAPNANEFRRLVLEFHRQHYSLLSTTTKNLDTIIREWESTDPRLAEAKQCLEEYHMAKVNDGLASLRKVLRSWVDVFSRSDRANALGLLDKASSNRLMTED